jgi:hypothetical protein
VLDAKVDNVVDIFFRESRQFHHDTGQIHVLALSDAAVVFDPAADFSSCFVRGENGQHKRTVSDKNLLAGLDGTREGRIGTGQLLGVSLEVVVRRENDGFTLDEVNLLGVVRKETRANLGPFGIQHNACVGCIVQYCSEGEMECTCYQSSSASARIFLEPRTYRRYGWYSLRLDGCAPGRRRVQRDRHGKS